MASHIFKAALIAFPFFIGVYAQAQDSSKIVQDADGKYVLFEEGKCSLYYYLGRNDLDFLEKEKDSLEREFRPSLPFLASHPSLPLGSIITISNPITKKSIKAEVVANHKPYQESDFLRINEDAVIKLFKNDFFVEEQVKVQFITPIDSILKSLPEQTPAEQFKSYLWLASFYKNYGANQALAYAQKAREQAEKMEDLDRQAEAWLNLGDIKNSQVEKKYYEDWNLSTPLQYTNQDIILSKLAKKTQYPAEDIKRWNRFGGYIPLFNLWYRKRFKLYPNPEQLSDQEYQEYLAIRKQQKDPDKIAWGLKKLGDLHRLKTGYAEAEKYYLEILKLREANEDQTKRNWIWGHLAYFYLEQNKFEAAEIYLQKLDQLRDSERDLMRKIWVLGGLRNLNYVKGDVKKALAYQEAIFKIHKQEGKNYYGGIKIILDDYLVAFQNQKPQILETLIDWIENSPDLIPREEKYLAECIARVANDLEKYSIAAKYLAYVLPSLKQQPEDQLVMINDIAFYYQKGGTGSKSLSYYKKGLKLAKQLNDTVSSMVQMNKLGYYYEAQSNLKKADKYYKKAYEQLDLVSPDWPTTWKRQRTFYHLLDQLTRISESYFYGKRKDNTWALKYAQAALKLRRNFRLIELIERIKNASR